MDAQIPFCICPNRMCDQFWQMMPGSLSYSMFYTLADRIPVASQRFCKFPTRDWAQKGDLSYNLINNDMHSFLSSSETERAATDKSPTPSDAMHGQKQNSSLPRLPLWSPTRVLIRRKRNSLPRADESGCVAVTMNEP